MSTFIGASTVYGSSSWPSSLTFGTSDLAAGVAVGDRLVLFVTVRYGQRTFPLPADTTLNSFGGLTGWDVVATAQNAIVGGASTSFTQVWTYTRRYVAGDLPLTATPLDPSGNPYTPILTSTYRLTLAAWRPSYGWSGNVAARSTDGIATGSTTAPDNSISASGVGAGVFVEGVFLSDNDLGSVSTANGFTVQHTQAAVTNRAGSFTIADKAFTSSQSASAATFVKPSGPSGAAIVFALDQLDPSLNTGWSVGQIKF